MYGLIPYRRYLSFFVVLALAGPVPTFAQAPVHPSRISQPGPDENVIQEASGFVFPASLAGVPRRKQVVYADDDWSVTYTNRGGGNGDCWLDLFVYPALQSLEAEDTQIAGYIAENYAGVSHAPPIRLPNKAADGVSRWFQGTIQGKQFVTGFTLVKRLGRFIQARASCPVGVDISVIQAELDAVDWNGVRIDARKSAGEAL